MLKYLFLHYLFYKYSLQGFNTIKILILDVIYFLFYILIVFLYNYNYLYNYIYYYTIINYKKMLLDKTSYI